MKKIAIFSIALLIVFTISVTNSNVLSKSDPNLLKEASKLNTDFTRLYYSIKNPDSNTYKLFIKVTKECYPDFKTSLTRNDFDKFLKIAKTQKYDQKDMYVINSVINKLKSSYYGTPSNALVYIVHKSLYKQIAKMSTDLATYQGCSYEKAYKNILSSTIATNGKLAKVLGINTEEFSSCSSVQTRENAFIYAHPYDVASVLSNWGDVLAYSIWTSHDGWVRYVTIGDDGTIGYLNIYEALPDGNWDSIHRYGSPSVSKGAYNSWVVNPMHVYIQRYPDQSLSQRAYNVSVNMYYGKPYNWDIANKCDPNRSYCSQNVWTGFWAYEVDLDSNLDIPALYITHPWAVSIELTGVLPDSIYLSHHLNLVSSG